MKELESLSAFRARTSGFTADSLPHSGGLQTNEHLPLKVAASGKLAPFMGNTVVFPLPERVKQEIGPIQRELYRTCASVLAEPLEAASLHLTLHDLLSGKPARELEERMGRVRDPALSCVGRIAEKGGTVRLRSTALFNMVGASMVLGFAPADEESCERLMTYYALLQEVVCLGYPLTPHVTVAYFRPGHIGAEMVEKLRAVVDEVNAQEKIEMELSANTLEYQLFSDMNHYWRER